MSQKEFQLIEEHFFWPDQTLASGVINTGGDDASLIQLLPNQQLAQSIDTHVEGVHFPTGFPPYYIAQRALRCAISDLAAMGAKPQGFHLALSLPVSQSGHGFLADFAKGLKDCAKEYGITLLGGDTTSGRNLVITIQVQGIIETGKALQRSGALIDDDIWLSGKVGTSAAVLEHVLQYTNQQPDFNQQPDLKAYYLPEAQIKLGLQLVNYASSALDISDGVLQDAEHIAEMSDVTLQLDIEKIYELAPTQITNKLEALKFALTGGDDYQLLFTASKEKREYISNLSNSDDSPPTLIGEVITKQDLYIKLKNCPNELLPLIQKKGFQHF